MQKGKKENLNSILLEFWYFENGEVFDPNSKGPVPT